MPYYLNITFADHILIRVRVSPYPVLFIFPQFFLVGLFYVMIIETSNSPGKLPYAQ